jgi:hypothetical protein
MPCASAYSVALGFLGPLASISRNPVKGGFTDTQPLQQLEEIGDALSPHCEFAVKAVPAIKANVKSTFFIIKRLKVNNTSILKKKK